MKTTKLTGMIKVISKIFTLVLFAAVFSSCDVLEADMDLQKPITVTTDNEVFVRPGSSTLIDLNSKVQTNQTVTLELTSQTRHGDLSNLGKGLLQYSPNAGTSRDAFTFTVYDKNNEAVMKDSVVIIIEDDSTNLPCGFYPGNDFVNQGSLQFSVIINVLANDIFCGYDSTELNVSIYQSDSSSFVFPFAGTARVLPNSTIEYATGSSFAGNDKFIYKIQARNDASVFGYGIVYIRGTSPCNLHVNDDDYSFSVDSTSLNSGLFLPVFTNDVRCDSATTGGYQYRVSKQPLHGSAFIDSNGIVYDPDDLSPGELRTDSLHYEVCAGTNCRGARTRIVLKN